VVAARRGVQVLAAPIVDDILAFAVFRRQALAAVKGVIGAGAAFIAALATVAATLGLPATFVAALVLAAALGLLIVVIAIAVVLAKGQAATGCDGDCQDA
jgi:cytochrome c biogenesis protein CcdA